MDKMTDDQRQRALNVTNADIAECLSHLCMAANLPHNEHRVTKIAGCVAGIERAIARVETMVLGQKITHHARMEAALLRAEQQFRDYAAQHAAKSTIDGDTKAQVNIAMAETMKKARAGEA